jgi:hypothetical protein
VVVEDEYEPCGGGNESLEQDGRHHEPLTRPTPSKGGRSDRWAYYALAVIAIGFVVLKVATAYS